MLLAGKRVIWETTIPQADRRSNNLHQTGTVLKHSVLCLTDYTISSDTIMVWTTHTHTDTQTHTHTHTLTHILVSLYYYLCEDFCRHIVLPSTLLLNVCVCVCVCLCVCRGSVFSVCCFYLYSFIRIAPSAVARKNSFLTGTNLEQDQAWKEGGRRERGQRE